MMRTLVGLTTVITLFFMLTAVLARQVAHSFPPDSSASAFVSSCQNKPLPCWNGIVVGHTTMADGRAILEADHYRPTQDGAGTLTYWHSGDLCSRIWLGYKADIITRIGMPVCTDLRLGSIATLFGHYYTVTQSGVTFREGQVAVGLPPASGGGCINLTPFSRVSQIWLSSEGITGTLDAVSSLLPRWRGYLSFERYQQLYVIGCAPLRPYVP